MTDIQSGSERDPIDLQELNCRRCGKVVLIPSVLREGHVVEDGKIFELLKVNGKPTRKVIPIYCLDCFHREADERSQG